MMSKEVLCTGNCFSLTQTQATIHGDAGVTSRTGSCKPPVVGAIMPPNNIRS